VKLCLHRVLPCLLLAAIIGKSQDPASPQTPAPPASTPVPPASTQTPPQQPSATLRAPVEVPSLVNNGHGLSIDAVYWFGKSLPDLRGGATDVNTEPGNFNYTTSQDKAIGYRLSVPIGTNAVVRSSYFQTQSTGFTFLPVNSILFGQAVVAGDFAATRYKIEAFKVSYEYLTYFWKRRSSEVRLKTLYEIQRISISNEVDDFVLNNDGVTYTINTATGSRSVFLPTFGLGMEYTMSPHVRVEARGSGFGLPHKGDIGDAEATVAYRRGHIEVIGGYRFLHFKTSPKSDQYNLGSLYGPYAGLRLYWKKQ
jgi:hypothetical protein